MLFKIKYIFGAVIACFLIGILFLSSNVFAQVSYKPIIQLEVVGESFTSDSGQNFSLVPILNTRSNQVDKIKLVISFNDYYIHVRDVNLDTADIDVHQENGFGKIISTYVNNQTGDIEIELEGNVGQDTTLQNFKLPQIDFESVKKGKSSIYIEPSSELMQGESRLSFQAPKFTAAMTTNSYYKHKFAHYQNSYLAQTDTDTEVKVIFASPYPVTSMIVTFKSIPESTEDNTQWESATMELVDEEKNEYSGILPGRVMNEPGVKYGFKVSTTKNNVILPQPITETGAFSLVSVPMQVLEDITSPVITVDVPGGGYGEPVDVTVSLNEEGVIFCTIDGTDPTMKSSVYEKSINIAKTTTLKCVGVDKAYNMTKILTEIYTLIDNFQVDFTVTPDTLLEPGNSMLSWEVKGSNTVIIDNGIGSVESVGQKVIQLVETTTYVLTANNGTLDKTKSVTVTVGSGVVSSDLEITASKTFTSGDESITLSWTSTGMTDVQIAPDIGIVDASGQMQVNPSKTTTYTISGLANGQTVTDTETVVFSRPSAASPTQSDTGPENLVAVLLGVVTVLGVWYGVKV